MFHISFLTPAGITEFTNEITLTNYTRILTPPYPDVLLTSLGTAALTTAICICVSLPLSLAIATCSSKLRNIVLLAICLPFWVSTLVRMYALQEILGRHGLINKLLAFWWNSWGLLVDGLPAYEPLSLLFSRTSVVIGLVYAFIPFGVLPIYATLANMNMQLIEASRDLGASTMQTFVHVTLPVARPGILAATLLIFVPSLGAFYINEILGGPGDLMIGNLIKLQFNEANNWSFGAALSVFMLFLMVAVLITCRPRWRPVR